MSNVSMVGVAMLASMEQTINGVLALDPASRDALAELEGRVIAVQLQGLDTTLYIAPSTDGLRLMGRFDGEPDTRLSGTPIDLLQMVTGETGEGLFGSGVTIDGDVGLGDRIKRIFQGLDLDLEEHLSHLTGDIVAHQLGNGLREFIAGTKNGVETLSVDLADYLKYELELLPTREEVDHFVNEVDRLRSGADRLAARIKILKNSQPESSS